MARFDNEVTFTVLNWKIMDKLIIDPEFDFENTDKELQIEFCFNILPEGRSILHKLSTNTETKDLGDQVAAIEQTKKLFEVTNSGTKQALTGAEPGIALEMPMLQDMYGASPLDSCLGKLQQRECNKDIFTYSKETQ